MALTNIKSDGDKLDADNYNGVSGMLITVEAGENITAGEAVYINKSDNKAYVSDTGTVNDYRFTGIALVTATATNDINIQTHGLVEGLTSLTAEDLYYLGAAGALSTTQSNILIGRAISTTTLQLIPNLDTYNNSVPIGCILPWAKSLTGVPSGLPANFLECNGSSISDSESPMNGQNVPNLNGSNYFLRGNSTSGATGGTTTHEHVGYAGGGSGDYGTDTGYKSDSVNHLPPYYNVVWIIRIK